jgi:hypothetical protein
MMRRYRPRTVARAPVAPPDLRRRRVETVPSADIFNWSPGEVARGPDPKRDSFWQRLENLYGAGRK